MNTKMLMLIAMVFYFAWKRSTDPMLLFCAVFALALWVCVLLYRLETTEVTTKEK